MHVLEEYLVILDYAHNMFFPDKDKEHHRVLGPISSYKLHIYICMSV